MKYLLIEPNGRVAQVCAARFPVALPYVWVGVADDAPVLQDDKLDLATGRITPNGANASAIPVSTFPPVDLLLEIF